MNLVAAAIAKSGPEIGNHCTDYSGFDLFAASIRKFGLEIGNHCTDYSGFDLCAAAIVKLTPSNQESLHESTRNKPHSCSDCQVWA